jgi:hypothetical protein
LRRQTAKQACRSSGQAVAYNLANFPRQPALPKPMPGGTLTTLREKLVKIGAKVVAHAKYVVFQLAEVAAPRQLIARVLDWIGQLRLACASGRGWQLRPQKPVRTSPPAVRGASPGRSSAPSVGNATGRVGSGCEGPAVVGDLGEKIVATAPSGG